MAARRLERTGLTPLTYQLSSSRKLVGLLLSWIIGLTGGAQLRRIRRDDRKEEVSAEEEEGCPLENLETPCSTTKRGQF